MGSLSRASLPRPWGGTGGAGGPAGNPPGPGAAGAPSLPRDGAVTQPGSCARPVSSAAVGSG